MGVDCPMHANRAYGEYGWRAQPSVPTDGESGQQKPQQQWPWSNVSAVGLPNALDVYS